MALQRNERVWSEREDFSKEAGILRKDARNFLFPNASLLLRLYILDHFSLLLHNKITCLQERSRPQRFLLSSVESLCSLLHSHPRNKLSSTQSPMARSFANVKVLSALVADGFSNTLTRYTNCFSFFFFFFFFFYFFSITSCAIFQKPQFVVGGNLFHSLYYERGNLGVRGGEVRDKESVKWWLMLIIIFLLWEQAWVCGGGDTKRNQRRCLHRRQYGPKIRGREGERWWKGFVGARPCYWLLQTREHQRDWCCWPASYGFGQKIQPLISTSTQNLFGHLDVRCISKFTEPSGIIYYKAIIYISFCIFLYRINKITLLAPFISGWKLVTMLFAVFSLENNIVTF